MDRKQQAMEPERQRMSFLYQRLASIGKTSGKDLKTRLKGMPVALRTSGLAVVAAQLNASDCPEDKRIGDLLAPWLLTHATVFSGEKQGEKMRDLLEQCVQASRLEYEAAQQEALRLMEQAKLLALALWS